MTSYLEKVLTLVDEASATPDLSKIISLIPIKSLKHALQIALPEVDEAQIKNIYYETAPLEDIISVDVIQSILSYNPLSASQRYVCKDFRKLRLKNEMFDKRKGKDFVNQYPGAPQWAIDSTNSVWVADNSRNELTKEELEKGYKGMLDLKETDDDLALCEPGDVVHVYGLISVYLSSFAEKKLSFFGMDGDAEIYFETEPEADRTQQNLYLYFEKLFISVDSENWETLVIDKNNENSNMWFQECDITAPIEIEACQSNMYFKNCTFSPRQNSRSALRVNIPRKGVAQLLEVIGCTFERCGSLEISEAREKGYNTQDRGCISFFSGADETDVDNICYKIIGNTFKNNSGRSILFHNINNNIESMDPYFREFVASGVLEMKYNWFEGTNARIRPGSEKERLEDVDPNKIYFSVHDW